MAKSFTVQIMEALTEYNAKVNIAVKEILPTIAKDASKQLKSVSPRKTGEYTSGWRQKTTVKTFEVEAVVYNSKAPGLTHLLEQGHAKRGGGRVPAYEHIKPVEEWVKTETAKRLEDALR